MRQRLGRLHTAAQRRHLNFVFGILRVREGAAVIECQKFNRCCGYDTCKALGAIEAEMQFNVAAFEANIREHAFDFGRGEIAEAIFLEVFGRGISGECATLGTRFSGDLLAPERSRHGINGRTLEFETIFHA